MRQKVKNKYLIVWAKKYSNFDDAINAKAMCISERGIITTMEDVSKKLLDVRTIWDANTQTIWALHGIINYFI